MRHRFKTLLGNVSPWMVIGMSLILVVVVLALAVINYKREKSYMERALSEKGSALIKSFEAGARTGMMGMMGDGSNLQVLLQETASQPDILYIAIVDSSGHILAHSDGNASRIGQVLFTPEMLTSMKPSKEIQWRVVAKVGQPKAFEVYKLFLSMQSTDQQKRSSAMMNNSMGQMMRGKMGNNRWEQWQPGWKLDRIVAPGKRPVIMIGMDSTPFEEAIGEDITMTATMSAVLVMLGLAGVVSLFWMQSHLRSRKLLQDTRALTSEIVANIPEGIVVCGPDGRITYVNTIGLKMFAADAARPSAIKGYATYFGSLFAEGSDNRKAAEVMTSEIDRLNRVISELLEMARPADIKRKETGIGLLLESSLRLVKQEAEGAGVKITIDVPPEIDTFPVDPDRLTQALINLYVNSIQAMPEGGELEVSARLKDKKLLLRIGDTGSGLSQDQLSQIFNPYFTTKKTGTGLGLAIVQKIVEAHDGTIEVERTGAGGTTFLLSMPGERAGERRS